MLSEVCLLMLFYLSGWKWFFVASFWFLLRLFFWGYFCYALAFFGFLAFAHFFLGGGFFFFLGFRYIPFFLGFQCIPFVLLRYYYKYNNTIILL